MTSIKQSPAAVVEECTVSAVQGRLMDRAMDDESGPSSARAFRRSDDRTGEAVGPAPWPLEDQPRGKLLTRGSAALTEAELLALVMSNGAGHDHALSVAHRLIARLGGLRELARASAREITAVPGVGPARAARVLAALETGRRLGRPGPPRSTRFRSGHEVYLAYRERLSLEKRETFFAIALDGKGRPFREFVVSIGSLTASLVHPREVFEPLIRDSAAAVLLVHNHPSGDPTPSPEDREITRRLRQVGELVGIRVIDHVVVAEEGYASLAELGWP